MLYGCGPCHSEMRDRSRWYFVTSFPKEGAFRGRRRPISARCESGIVPLISLSAFYGSAMNLTGTPPVAIFLGPATPRRVCARCLPACPPVPHCWKRRWQSLVRRIFIGQLAPLAPVPKTHKIPLRTARVSCHGRPRPSDGRFGRKIGSITSRVGIAAHRPRMPAFCPFSYSQKIAK
jgi:hypothetical protein